MGVRRKIIVAGAGMSGLTAAAYLLRGGHDVLVLEKSAACGGLVSSFRRDGFLFDTGPRAIGNAGILGPLLADLDIDLPLVKGAVSTGIRDRIVHHDGDAGIDGFLDSLRQLFPGNQREIRGIARRIRSATAMARALNRMPNPFFEDPLRDPGFFFGRFLPRMPGFLATVARLALDGRTMESALAALSGNPSLNDMVSQHFFKGTPASFVFGYFENFQDYRYPLGGTGRLPEALARLVESGGGRICTDTEIMKILPAAKKLVDQRGTGHDYDLLVWCADLKTLYERTVDDGLAPRVRQAVDRERRRFGPAKTGESVFTLFLAVDQPPAAFAAISRGHFIYTPRTEGLGELHRHTLDRIKAVFPAISKQELLDWLAEFCRRNSYEISLPVLKDPSLAPAGQTGLVVSILVDGELFRLVEQAGWSEEFRQAMAEGMLDALEASVYPGLRSTIIFRDTATPLTLSGRFNTTNGAITGWSMETRPPVPRSLAGIAAAPRCALPGVFKAGQWTYSPAGVPVAILTGRMAAAAALRAARTGPRRGQ